MRYKTQWGMKGFVSLAVAIGFLVQTPVAGAALTIEARPNPITFGDATTISGNLSGASYSESAITLEANGAAVATTNADANGNYSFTKVAPGLNTRYRSVSDGCVAICPLDPAVICPVIQAVIPCGGGDVSPELLVEVRIKVVLHTSHIGDRVRFYGTAAPAHDGRTVHIQRRKRNGKWVDVAQASLKAAAGVPGRSVFGRGLAGRPGRYRARVYHDADHADGTSRSRRIR